MFFADALLAVLAVLAIYSLDTHPQTLRKIPITCDAGAFIAGEHASVTCNFHEIMPEDKRGINVVRYRLNATDNELGTDVLACEWKDTLQSYHCIVEKGYTFDNDITDRLTVGIPTVSVGYTGLYMCFIVPSEETEKHACELKIKGLYSSTTPPRTHIPGGKEDTNSHAWISVLVVLTLGVIAVVVFVIWKRRNSTKKKQQNKQDCQEMIHILPQTEQSTPHPTANPKSESDAHKKTVETVMKGFMLTMLDCERVRKLLHREMKLSATSDSAEHTKQSLPKGTETGDFVSVNLGIDGVDIQFVRLSGAKTDVQSDIYDLPTDSTADEAIEAEETDSMSFFSLVAEAVKQFVQSHHLSKKAIPSEFVCCTPSGFDDDVTFDHLTKYTKGYFCEDDKGKDPADSLQHILRKINATRRVKIKPTIKDPVGTLLSGVYKNQACNAAFLSDAKLTACYFPKQTRDQKEVKITIIEWGAFGDTGFLDVFRTDFDMMLDKSSESPGENILEKMISWRHLGEIVRLVLLELVEEDLLSMSVPDNSALRKTSGFTTKHLLLIDSDVDGHTAMTEFVLDELQVQNPTTEDCNIVRDVCKTIFRRSACLTASALAALITFLNQSDFTIAVDGCMYRDHPTFHQTVKDKIKELVKENPKKFKLLPQHNGRRVGAAVAAVLSTPPIQTTKPRRKSARQLVERKRIPKDLPRENSLTNETFVSGIFGKNILKIRDAC